jgi:hypothetical protein
MKRILLAVLLLTATSAWAEWVKLGDNGDGEFAVYVDPAAIRKSSNMVKMWNLMDYKTLQETQGNRYQSIKTQSEYDCKDERWRVLYFTWHSGQIGGGKVVYTYGDKPGNWTPVSPGSTAEILWKVACGKK